MLLHALDCPAGAEILSIASAGDNTLSLLTTAPNKITAIDTNPLQLHLLELKAAAFQSLTHEEMLCFLGFRTENQRWEIYQQLRSDLSPSARKFWDEQRKGIEQGAIHNGKFERYLRGFGKYVLPWIHSQSTRVQLIAPKSAQEQEAFFENRWNTWRWRFLMKQFFSRSLMATFGRDPAYLKQVKVNVSEHALRQANEHLKSKTATQNPFLEYMIHGNFDQHLPHYARPENFDRIRDHLGKLELQNIAFSEITATYDRMNCSNIFEYMDEETCLKHARLVCERLQPSGKVAYWNLMVERKLHDLFPEKLQTQPIDFPDTGFFYRSFHLDMRTP